MISSKSSVRTEPESACTGISIGSMMHLCPLRFWACTSSCARSQPIAGGAQCRQSVQGKCLCPANLRPACSPVIDDARCHALRYWRSALPAHSDQDASARTVTETSAHSATGALRHVHFGFELHVLTHPTRHRPIAFVRSRGLANRRPAAGCVLRPGHAGRRGEHAHNRGRRQTRPGTTASASGKSWQWEPHDKRGSTRRSVFGPYSSAAGFDDSAADRQTQTGSRRGDGLMRSAHKLLENPLQVLGRNARAFVFHA
jgi:hypothetical protein